MRSILAALDFSRVADRVIDVAASLAQAYSAQLTLIHIAAPEPDFVGYTAGPPGTRHERARELRGEHRELQEKAEALRAQGIEARALIVEGATVARLLEESRALETDAIVIGSHGHGELYRALVGSTADGVIRGAACPVVVVPARPGGADR